MAHDKYAIYIIVLVAIVGIVSLSAFLEIGDLTGQAVKQTRVIQYPCSEDDGGDNPYDKGLEYIGTFEFGLTFMRSNSFQDTCLLHNKKAFECSGNGCEVKEYYCADDGYLRWKTYDGNCYDGILTDYNKKDDY